MNTARIELVDPFGTGMPLQLANPNPRTSMDDSAKSA
jgi:hypothetical protein